jgi:hypothetical protein
MILQLLIASVNKLVPSSLSFSGIVGITYTVSETEQMKDLTDTTKDTADHADSPSLH